MSLATRAAVLPRVRSLAPPVVFAIAGSLVLAAAARIATPFVPVPTTLQTYALLGLAAFFGPRLAVAMALTYLAEGLAGLPVFAGGAGGPLVLLGPTAGYLLAFPVAAVVVGHLHHREGKLGLVPSFAVMLLGHLVVVAGGVAWLAPTMGLSVALALGGTPFIVGSLVKSAMAVVTVRLVRQRWT